ncbi:hypothetical protein ZWY2020_005282 [Hordeum vulgare]|nr:hypothetical protein ZWY2020_005282 [Hordeum vulgare]
MPRPLPALATRAAKRMAGAAEREETPACCYGPKINGLKDQLIDSSLSEEKGSQSKLTSESISNATPTNEQLRSLVLY